MSYILDALRRADAERQRGGLPGLNTPVAAVVGDAAAPQRGRRWLIGAGLLAAAALAGALAALLLGRGAPPATPPSAAAPMPGQTPAPPAQPLPAPAPQPTPVVVVVPPPPVAPAAAPTPAPAAAPGHVPVPAPARPQALPTLAELPDGLRQQLPALQVGGSVYSEQPAQRLVIVNGQVLHEGDEAAPGVRVLQIRPRAVVFGAGGQQFQAPF